MVPLSTAAVHYVSADEGVLCDITVVLGDTIKLLRGYGVSRIQ